MLWPRRPRARSRAGTQPPRGGPRPRARRAPRRGRARPAEGPSASRPLPSRPLPAGRACLGLAAAEASPSVRLTDGAGGGGSRGSPRRAVKGVPAPGAALRPWGRGGGWGAEGGPVGRPAQPPRGGEGFVPYRLIAAGVYARGRFWRSSDRGCGLPISKTCQDNAGGGCKT